MAEVGCRRALRIPEPSLLGAVVARPPSLLVFRSLGPALSPADGFRLQAETVQLQLPLTHAW